MKRLIKFTTSRNGNHEDEWFLCDVSKSIIKDIYFIRILEKDHNFNDQGLGVFDSYSFDYHIINTRKVKLVGSRLRDILHID